MNSMFYLLKWKNDLNIEDIIFNLRELNYLPITRICPNCTNDMVIHKDSSRKDHFRWVCKRCRKRKPIRVNTWASKYRIPFIDLYVLIRYYVENENIRIISKRLNLESGVIENFFEDLDRLETIYANKLKKVFEESGPGPELKSVYAECDGDFREISKIFRYPVVFNVILETLQEAN